MSDEIYEGDETQRIVVTLAHHELGDIPAAYAQALRALSQRFTSAPVIDFWSPKAAWLQV